MHGSFSADSLWLAPQEKLIFLGRCPVHERLQLVLLSGAV